MLRNIKFSIFVITLLSYIVKGQDTHYTQFYAAPMNFNPAFCGANVCSRITSVYRNQWPSVNKAYQSYLLSIDHNFIKQKIGAGLLMSVDNAGTGGLRTTQINPTFGYEVRLRRDLGLRFGLAPGVTIKSINFSKLLFGDQIGNSYGSDPRSTATVETPTKTRAFVDVSAGVLVYRSNYWGGLSFSHINQPNESFYDFEEVRLPLKYSAHGGVKMSLNADEKDPDLKKYISVVGHYRGQAEFDQLDLGVYYTQYVFNIGLWYRGIPVLKYYKPGYANNDAVSAIIGFQSGSLNIGYSYDFTISKLYKATQGAHEVTLSYQLCTPRKTKKRQAVSCPQF